VGSSSSQNSLTLTGRCGRDTAAGFSNGTTTGLPPTPAPTRPARACRPTSTTVLAQIDQLAKDSSYKASTCCSRQPQGRVQREGTSSLTISGVTTTPAASASRRQRHRLPVEQHARQQISRSMRALTTLRSQASKFGSKLTTVQARQILPKASSTRCRLCRQPVLADTNEEGANLLALQTRQQLSPPVCRWPTSPTRPCCACSADRASPFSKAAGFPRRLSFFTSVYPR